MDKQQLKEGAIIIYRLRPDQLPTNPDRLWTGRIIKVFPERANIESGVVVKLLDSGYEEDTEVVTLRQIVRVIGS
ncbi:MAG TPA: hypothetical protein VFA41_18435 [Ktedonobacteraceae bacterium]|jgi:hypothetical protein|nr:hypothetical protein [Ktedonobacteraceae bacterium]